MNDPYTSPVTKPNSDVAGSFDLAKAEKKRKVWKRVVWLSLSGVIVPILIAVIGFLIGMSRAVSHLEESDGSADSSQLAGHISTSLLSGLYGLLISIVALVVLIIAMCKFFGVRRDIKKYYLLGGQGGEYSRD